MINDISWKKKSPLLVGSAFECKDWRRIVTIFYFQKRCVDDLSICPTVSLSKDQNYCAISRWSITIAWVTDRGYEQVILFNWTLAQQNNSSSRIHLSITTGTTPKTCSTTSIKENPATTVSDTTNQIWNSASSSELQRPDLPQEKSSCYRLIQ